MSELRFDHVTYEGAIFLWQSFRYWRNHAAQSARFQQVRKRLSRISYPAAIHRFMHLYFQDLFGKNIELHSIKKTYRTVCITSFLNANKSGEYMYFAYAICMLLKPFHFYQKYKQGHILNALCWPKPWKIISGHDACFGSNLSRDSEFEASLWWEPSGVGWHRFTISLGPCRPRFVCFL